MAQRPTLRKREIVLAVALGAVAAGGAGIMISEMHEGADSGPQEISQTYTVGPFEQLSTVGPQDVEITRGDTFAVRAEGSPEDLALLQPVVENGVLKIQPKSGFNWSDLDSVTVYVTAPRLQAVSLSGSGDVSAVGFDGPAFKASLLGSGELSLGALRVDSAEFSITGSGSIEAEGQAGTTRISLLGSGDVRASGLRSTKAEVTSVGSGDTELTVDGEAQVQVGGSGDVAIDGAATCTVSRGGSGNVRCGGEDD